MSRYENEELFIEVIKASNNITDVCRNLKIGTTKGNRDTVKKYILKYEVDTSHFKIGIKSKLPHKMDLVDILVDNSTYTYTGNLKHKLYDSGLKDRKCELCDQDEFWNGMKISLILDHKNGKNNDNRIENLRIVCPNCNAGLDTHGGKNIKNYKYESVININKCECGSIICNTSKKCKSCDSTSQRKVERPEYKKLLLDVNELGFSATGRKYGVSDNSIRKWLKVYEK